MRRSPAKTTVRLLAFASVYLFWGSTYPAIRALVRHLPPFLLSGGRLVAAGLALMALARARGAAWPSRRQWLGSAALGLVFLVLCNGVATWGLQYIEAGKATLITACVPLVALAWGWAVQGRRASAGEAACLGLGLAGVALLLKPAAAAPAHWAWGLAAILWAVVVWAVGMAEARRFPQPADGLLASGVQMAVGGLVLLALSAALESPTSVAWGALSWRAWGLWAYLVVFGSCVGYLCFNWLLRHEPPHLAGTYAFVNPLVAVVLGTWLLDEPLGARTLLASALIVGAVAGLLRLERNDAPVA